MTAYYVVAHKEQHKITTGKKDHTMEKIKALLEKAGCNPELVNAICESLEGHKTAIREQFEADYAAKIDKAKKACVEETENHKCELARRLQIFCETKNNAIELQLTKQTVLRESDALAKLKNIQNLVLGLPADQTATQAITESQKKLKKLSEEKTLAITTANRQTQIAEKVLKQNRQLVAENAKLKRQLSDADAPLSEATIKNRPQRIDGSRRTGRPVTTRQPIVENQVRRPIQPAHQPAAAGKFGVTDIASQMDDY